MERYIPGMDKFNLDEKLDRIHDTWNPRIVAELNGQHVKLVKLAGPFVWHRHDREDEMFLVLHGRMRMELRDRALDLGVGDAFVVPRGVEHRPAADQEAAVLLFEPATTLNTGNVRDERTRDSLERI